MPRHHWILLLLILLVHPHSSATTTDKSIFLLAGQSNIAGRGGVINNIWDEIIPPSSTPTPTILRLTPNLQWHVAKEPLHRGIDVNHTCGVGPGMSFANSVIERVERIKVVGLVPCGVGGTNISQWSKGGRLYGELVRRVERAVRDGGSIEGLVWYQGESDTVEEVDAGKYRVRLGRFFGDVRSDLNSPMLPIIQVAIATGLGPYIEEVRQAQMGIDLLNLKTVDAMGLALEPDRLHLTTQAQVQLGVKLADAFVKFLPNTHVQPYPGMLIQQTNDAILLNTFWPYTWIIGFLFIFLHLL